MRSRWNLSEQLTNLGDLRLRKAQPCDEHFLLHLFRSSRPHLDQIPLPAEFVDALVQQQYDLQRSFYTRQFPGYINFLMLLHQEPIGGLKLYEGDQSRCLHLLDIGVLTTHRERGYGGMVLRSLQLLAQKNDLQLHLSVDRQNWRAKKLYDFLGFRLMSTSDSHEHMMWQESRRDAAEMDADAREPCALHNN